MINLFTFETNDGDTVMIPRLEVSDATAQARDCFENKKFRLVKTEQHPDWDDFAEVFDPQCMLDREAPEDTAAEFFIEPAEVPHVKGFHDLAKNGHVWTVKDCYGVLWITPGFHYVDRFAYIVTKKAHQFSNTKDYLHA